MNKVEVIFNQIESLKLNELLMLCAGAIEKELKQEVIDSLLMHLEMRIQKRRMMRSLGIKEGE